MGLIKILTEGGQIWAHRFRMLRQVVKMTFLLSSSTGMILFAVRLTYLPTEYYEATWYFLRASIGDIFWKEIEISPSFLKAIDQPWHKTVWPTGHIIHFTEPYVQKLKELISENFSIALIVSLLTSLATLLFFLLKGITLGNSYVSGSKIASSWSINFKLKLSQKASSIKIGGVSLVKNTETQHILITGGTGSGKTNCLHHILKQAIYLQHPALVVDTTGAFIERYYDSKKDIILNPFDPRSASWHPWIECQNRFDYEALAESFIPHGSSEYENYWHNAARSVFSTVLQRLNNDQKTSELIRWLLYEPLPNLCKFVQGTKAASHLDISSEKTASSIRSVATTFLDCLECLADAQSPFSIRNWVGGIDKKRWLFIQCTPAQRASLRPLISTWISITIRSLINLKPDFNRRIWFFLDELPTLQKIKDLETLVTEGRKYGGCGVLALQSPSQIETIYGRELTNTIIGNTATKIVFSEHDPVIAERISKSFGEQEIKEMNEGISYGANDMRDGVNLSWQAKHRPLVSATDIQSLEKNEAFLKLPGNLPCTKIKLRIAK